MAQSRSKATSAKGAATSKRAAPSKGAARTSEQPAPAETPEGDGARARREGPEKQAAAEAAETTAGRSRADRLRQAVAKIRARGAGFDVQRLFMIGGGVVLLLGLVFIGLAWYGAAHTPYLFEQVPYLISGGLLGLGLAFAGGFFYFAYWMTRLVRENREQSNRLADSVGRLQELLAKGPVVAGDAAGSNGSFVVTARGTMFHRPNCPIVQGRDDVRSVTETDGLKPCKVCEPLEEAMARA